jgi:phosphoserine phosphatase RsbU/P
MIAFERISRESNQKVASVPEIDEHSQRRAAPRKTIAVLVDYVNHLGAGYEAQLRLGFERACLKHDVNLLFVVGRHLDSPDPMSAVHNGVYQLVFGGGVDGAILVAAGLGSVCGVDRLVRLTTEMQPTSLCSLGIELPGVPSIVIENHLGMAAVLEHLIDVHGCRRMAFIGGPQKNPDAIARFQVYRQVLAQYDLPFSPELVALGDFTFPTGMLAANVLLECGAKFEAIVAANDEMALGAIEALRQRAMRVPRDMRVVGFDDLVTARFSNPPLTTARQPLEKMAALAIEHIVAQWAGRQAPALTRLPVEVVARRSCGCLFRKGRHSMPCPAPRESQTGILTKEDSARLAAQMDQILTQSGVATAVTGEQLLQAVNGEFKGQRDAFLTALDTLLDQAGHCNEFFDDVQMVVTLMRDEFNSVGATQFEDLWDTARRTIALANTRSQSEQRSNIELKYYELLRCGERFSGVPSFEALKRAMAEELPLIPINDVLIAKSVRGQFNMLEPFVGLRDGIPITLLQTRVQASQLLTIAKRYFDQRLTAFAFPLTFETEYLGAALFGSQVGLGVSGMLREQISFALKTIELHEELAKRTAQHERSVQERVAATTRMETLSVMAGGVAHDLNSALSPLVALPDLILALVNQLGVDASPEGQRLRSYVGTIKSAAFRATQTIRDLMTLGRQGRTSKAPLDLNWVAASCVSAEPSLAMQSEGYRVAVEMRLFPHPLLVNASQYHVERAISNLVRNAVEAIGENGTLTVCTSVAHIEKPVGEHETVAPGEYAMLVVSDTGPGIPRDLIARVFEPFFSNKILRDSSGSGLGLSIVHGVVKEHEGFIDVSSEQGQGTTFTLYFPLAKIPPTVASGSGESETSNPEATLAATGDATEAASSSIPGRIDAA